MNITDVDIQNIFEKKVAFHRNNKKFMIEFDREVFKKPVNVDVEKMKNSLK